ncbi:MAG: DUF4293 domain-containing protein [Bacteroidales bacterium]|nr:DUF4293 domain-containing protein [Bacteroidales bacterium]
MIQRIQSLFLLIGIIVPIVLIILPIGIFDTANAQYIYNSLCVKMNIPDGIAVLRLYYLAFTLALCAILCTIALFTYKNRVRQSNIVSITMIVYLIALLLMLWVCPDIIIKKFFSLRGETITGFHFANQILLIILIAVEAVCLYLANKFIKKDEALVRSADRLR